MGVGLTERFGTAERGTVYVWGNIKSNVPQKRFTPELELGRRRQCSRQGVVSEIRLLRYKVLVLLLVM